MYKNHVHLSKRQGVGPDVPRCGGCSTLAPCKTLTTSMVAAAVCTVAPCKTLTTYMYYIIESQNSSLQNCSHWKRGHFSQDFRPEVFYWASECCWKHTNLCNKDFFLLLFSCNYMYMYDDQLSQNVHWFVLGICTLSENTGLWKLPTNMNKSVQCPLLLSNTFN